IETLPQQQRLGPREPGEHLVRAGQVELGQIGEDQHSASEAGLAHACLPRARQGYLSVVSQIGKLEETVMPLMLVSPAIPPGGEVAPQPPGGGADIAPRLRGSSLREGTKSLVLVVEDRAAPPGVSRHWAIFDTPAAARGLEAGYSATRPATGFREARNDF